MLNRYKNPSYESDQDSVVYRGHLQKTRLNQAVLLVQ